MDILTRFKSAIVEFDTTQSIIGSYAGIPAPRISRGLTEETPFEPAESLVISDTIAAMRSLQSEMPLPADWSRIGRCRTLIEQRRKELREQEDPVIHKCVLIRISATSFFRRANGNAVMTTPSEMSAAAFETPVLADKAVTALKKLGTNSRTETFGAFRRQSTMCNTLIDCGLDGDGDEQ